MRLTVCPNVSVCIFCLIQLTPKARQGSTGYKKHATYFWPEGGTKGHLPDYVSVTSKKEERRDTWSESDKSVKHHMQR